MERERSVCDLLRFLWAFSDDTFVLIVSAIVYILLEGVLRRRFFHFHKRDVSWVILAVVTLFVRLAGKV
jgi:hypothetical protein